MYVWKYIGTRKYILYIYIYIIMTYKVIEYDIVTFHHMIVF